MPEVVIPILRTFPMFSDAKESTLRALVPSCIFQSFSAGITINKVGEIPAFIYCLRSGSVEGWASLNDAETIVATSAAPMVFEVSTAVQHHASVLAIVTREASETIAIETSAFLKAIQDDQAVCHAALIHASRVNMQMIDRLPGGVQEDAEKIAHRASRLQAFQVFRDGLRPDQQGTIREVAA